MFYYLYQITNKVNGKIYVGVHKTQNLDDGYMGSGKRIQYAFEKYGIDSFEKVILETFENAEAMYAREKEVVNEEFLLREDVYNLRRGGNGGFDYINKQSTSTRIRGWTEANTEKARLARQKLDFSAINKNRWDLLDVESKQKHTSVAREIAKTPEAIVKRKETFKNIKHQAASNNSQFGTCWIYHELIGNKKCKKELLPFYIEQGWIKGRK